MDSITNGLIAAATIAQGIFAWRLLALQRAFEKERKRTSVHATLELRRIQDADPQLQVHIENASGSGIDHRELQGKIAIGNSEKNFSWDFRISIAPWGRRDEDITQRLSETLAALFNSEGRTWRNLGETISLTITPRYLAGDKEQTGYASDCQIDFSNGKPWVLRNKPAGK